MIDLGRYLLPAFSADLTAWNDLLPDGYSVLRANCFADFFVVDGEGAVYMLELAAGSLSRIAESENQFWLDLAHDDEGWLLRPLVDRCREAGLMLRPDTCYAFTTFPVLGGKYEVENIFVCPVSEWVSLMGEIYATIKDLPDGAQVEIRVVD